MTIKLLLVILGLGGFPARALAVEIASGEAAKQLFLRSGEETLSVTSGETPKQEVSRKLAIGDIQIICRRTLDLSSSGALFEFTCFSDRDLPKRIQDPYLCTGLNEPQYRLINGVVSRAASILTMINHAITVPERRQLVLFRNAQLDFYNLPGPRAHESYVVKALAVIDQELALAASGNESYSVVKKLGAMREALARRDFNALMHELDQEAVREHARYDIDGEFSKKVITKFILADLFSDVESILMKEIMRRSPGADAFQSFQEGRSWTLLEGSDIHIEGSRVNREGKRRRDYIAGYSLRIPPFVDPDGSVTATLLVGRGGDSYYTGESLALAAAPSGAVSIYYSPLFAAQGQTVNSLDEMNCDLDEVLKRD